MVRAQRVQFLQASAPRSLFRNFDLAVILPPKEASLFPYRINKLYNLDCPPSNLCATPFCQSFTWSRLQTRANLMKNLGGRGGERHMPRIILAFQPSEFCTVSRLSQLQLPCKLQASLSPLTSPSPSDKVPSSKVPPLLSQNRTEILHPGPAP